MQERRQRSVTTAINSGTEDFPLGNNFFSCFLLLDVEFQGLLLVSEDVAAADNQYYCWERKEEVERLFLLWKSFEGCQAV
ncbi:hypothetical protein KQX54_007868 [Cotesia glomerata]|uniref:Uncharacterized protein n=1 Tax=Cotesia glomerata TaxID=32391 RepID=A0AAV7J369_COTGL|nr:hypothetical protein KQX54_007868 [Cotesia glomerata]